MEHTTMKPTPRVATARLPLVERVAGFSASHGKTAVFGWPAGRVTPVDPIIGALAEIQAAFPGGPSPARIIITGDVTQQAMADTLDALHRQAAASTERCASRSRPMWSPAAAR
jgi:hypothetical protein